MLLTGKRLQDSRACTGLTRGFGRKLLSVTQVARGNGDPLPLVF